MLATVRRREGAVAGRARDRARHRRRGDGAPATATSSRALSATWCSNAIRYTPAGGTITLAWRVDADGSGRFLGHGLRHRHRAGASCRGSPSGSTASTARARAATGGTGLRAGHRRSTSCSRHQAELEIESERWAKAAFAQSAARAACAARAGRRLEMLAPGGGRS